MEKLKNFGFWLNDNSGAIQAGASILTLLIMGAIAFFTWQATDRAAIASKAAADIAARQQSFQERQQRARPSVTEARLVPGELRQDKYQIDPPVREYRLELKIKNSGGFPARNVHLAIASDSIGVLNPESQDVGTIENDQELIITSPPFDARSDFDTVKIAFAFWFTDDGSGKCAVSLPQEGHFVSVNQTSDQPEAYALQFQGITQDELNPNSPAIFGQTPAMQVLNEVRQKSGAMICPTA